MLTILEKEPRLPKAISDCENIAILFAGIGKGPSSLPSLRFSPRERNAPGACFSHYFSGGSQKDLPLV